MIPIQLYTRNGLSEDRRYVVESSTGFVYVKDLYMERAIWRMRIKI